MSDQDPPPDPQDIQQRVLALAEAQLVPEHVHVPTVTDTSLLEQQLREAHEALEVERRKAFEANENITELRSKWESSQEHLSIAQAGYASEKRSKDDALREKEHLAAELVGLSAQLSSLKSLTQGGVRQSTELRDRAEQAEQEKRDILGSLQREREENTRKGQEIETLLSRVHDSRQEISRLGSALQESQSQESIAKYRLQGLEQELQLVKKDAEWTHDQLTKANEASASFRTAKRIEISALQNQLDAASQEAAASKSKVASLEAAYEESSSRLNQSSEKVAELQSRLATQEDSFRSEISTQSQLAKLLERRAEHSTTRIAELEDQWEEVLEQCRIREEAAWAETEKEAQLRENLERQNEELSEALDRLAQGVGIGQPHDGADDEVLSDGGDFDIRSTASTPRRGFMGTAASFHGLHSHSISPTAEIANRIRKGGKSFSQIYVELAKSQEELRRERLETSRLTDVLAQVMDELQDHAPQLQAQRQETEQLANDLQDMVQQTAFTSQERDDAKAEAMRFQLELQNISRENTIMSQQLADFGRQVRELLKTIILRDDPDAASRLEDDGLAAELDAAAPIMQDTLESDTQSVITSELVTFASLAELCAQNARLLQVTRQLGAKMEEEERNYKARLAEDQDEAVSEARDLITRLEEQVLSERYKLDEVSKERDLFRQLCATGGRTEDAAVPAQKAAAAPALAAPGFGQPEYDALRSKFDSFKREADADIVRYKEELRALQSETSRSTVASVREQALRQAAEEKYSTLQRTFELQKNELNGLSQRVNSLQESVTQKEASQQSTEEQLSESRSTTQHLQAQVANLQAEKDVRKSSEDKLLEENRLMLIERGNLQELVRNTQAMQTELEQRGKDARVRLEHEVKRLGESNEELQARLSSEQELYRQLSLRREVEVKDLQSKVDASTTELSNAREALAIARTSADHIQLRVEDLSRQLEASKDKLAVYERRDQLARDPASFRSQTEGELSREEQLQIELADLKAGRAAAQVEVQKSRLQLDELTAAVAEKQSALDSVTTTLEELRASSSSELETKSKEIEALQAQMQTITTDLSAAQTQGKELQEQIESQNLAFQDEKKSLEDAITELSAVEEKAMAAQEDVKGEIRKHVQAAKEAEQKLVDIERVREQLSTDLNEAREQLAKARQEASALRSSKDLSEAEWGREKGGWDTARQALEREKTDLQRRIQDLTSQNEILHSHLETINTQANQIRQTASAPPQLPDEDVSMELAAAEPAAATGTAIADGEAGDPAAHAADGAPPASTEPSEAVQAQAGATSGAELSAAVMKRRVEEYREVVSYLRREKEIVDLQMELNKQETARLKQSLDHVNKTLTDTRTELDAERAKSASTASQEAHHAELLEKINALHELRSAHATLQETADRSNTRLVQVEAELAAARTELDPLNQKLRDAQVELEASQAQTNILREDHKRWQARAESLLQTHGLSEEMQKAEQQRAETQTKFEELEKKVTEQEAATETVKAELATSKGNFEKLREQVRARIAQERKAVAELQEKATALQKAKDEEEARSKEVIQMHETNVQQLIAERDQLRVQLKEAQTVESSSKRTSTEPITVVDSDEEEKVGGTEEDDRQAAIEAAVRQAQDQFDAIKTKLESENAQLAAARDKHLQKGKEFLRDRRVAEAEVKKRDETIEQLKKSFAESNAEAIEQAVRERIDAETVADGDQTATIMQLRSQVSELETKLKATETRIQELEAQLKSGVASGSTKSEHEAELRELEASLTEKYAAQHKIAIEEAFKRGQQSGATSPSTGGQSGDVESLVQQRLKALEDEREKAVQEAVQTAVRAREQELKTQYDESSKARFEAGKNEANLRNQLMIKQKDNKIAKLTAEIAQLKGEEVPTVPTSGAGAAPAPAAGLPSRPGVFGRGGAQAGAARGGRGGAPGQVSARPVPTVVPIAGTAAAAGQAGQARPTASIRGAATAGRGGPVRIANAAARGGRGGTAQAAGAKRKLSAQGLPSAPGQPGGAAGTGAGTEGAAAKKPRPAGAPVAIRKPDSGPSAD